MKTPSEFSTSAPVFHPETVQYVLLRNDSSRSPDCELPYAVITIDLYCVSGIAFPEFKLLGIYPSERAALDAMRTDAMANGEAQS